MLMVGTILLAVMSGATAEPQLHVSVRVQGCQAADELERALTARMPELKISHSTTVGPADRTAVLDDGPSGYRLELWDAQGHRELLRQLPGTCETAAQLASAVLERHFAEVAWPPEAPEV